MDSKGQSLLEVIFVFPFLFLFVVLLFKMNLSVQMSINNTQYARSQVYMLTGNSPEYPRLQFRYSRPTMFAPANEDMMVLGVAELDGNQVNSDTLEPLPQTQKITRNNSIKGSNDSGEVSSRSDIRVRGTSAICTQLNMPPNSNGSGLKAQRWPFGRTPCSYAGGWIGDF